jgi:hypothetical protein
VVVVAVDQQTTNMEPAVVVLAGMCIQHLHCSQEDLPTQ